MMVKTRLFLTYGCIGAGLLGCVGTHDAGRNNVFISKTTNSSVVTDNHGSGKGGGFGARLVFKGNDNLVTFNVDSSVVRSSDNGQSVIVVEGNQNRISSDIRKCVIIYKNRADTIIIKGNKLRLDWRANKLTIASEDGHSKQVIDRSTPNSDLSPGYFATPDRPTDPTLPDLPAPDSVELFVPGLKRIVKLVTAVNYYTKLANAGDGAAAYELGRLYDEGSPLGASDMERAMRSYETAARRDHLEATLRLAALYESGYYDAKLDRQEQDPAKALYYYRLAAKKGSTYAKQQLRDFYGE